jgi:membrane protein required for colicin V production
LALFSIIALIIGLAAALKLSTLVASWLSGNSSIASKWIPFVSFALVFIGIVMLVNWTGQIIQKTIETLLLGWANKIGGILLYLVLYTIIFSILLFYGIQLHF